MKKINQELIALFDKYGSDRRRALRENKKLSYLYALADLRENLLDWCQFDPEQQALQIGADSGRADRAACQTFIIGNGAGCFRRKSGGSTPSFQDRAGSWRRRSAMSVRMWRRMRGKRKSAAGHMDM